MGISLKNVEGFEVMRAAGCGGQILSPVQST